MLFLTLILGLTTLLLCYAGYVFLIVDKRQEKQILENPEVYESLDDKDYNFDLPIEIDEYEEYEYEVEEPRNWRRKDRGASDSEAPRGQDGS